MQRLTAGSGTARLLGAWPPPQEPKVSGITERMSNGFSSSRANGGASTQAGTFISMLFYKDLTKEQRKPFLKKINLIYLYYYYYF